MLEAMGNEFLPNCSLPTLDESVGERNIFYRLGESEIFQYANKNTGSNGMSLIDIIPRMVVKDNGFTQLTLAQFDKSVIYELFESGRFKMTCKAAMKRMIDEGKVVLVVSDQYRIPTCIPYIAQTGKRNECTIYANISDFVDMNQYGIYQVSVTRNYNAIMGVIFAACSAYRIITTTSQLPADLGDGLVLMYASMMERTLNSLLHLDPVTKDKVKYLATEFALIQMYGTEQGTKMFYRYKTQYFPKLSKLITESIDAQFKLDSFDTLTLFINQLTQMYPSMRGLTIYNVYDKWIRSYGAATAMSVDYIGYHLYTVCMVLMESPLITRITLEPILEKSKGTDMYKRLQAMIGNQ